MKRRSSMPKEQTEMKEYRSRSRSRSPHQRRNRSNAFDDSTWSVEHGYVANGW
jgi:hypothetical protein